MKSLMSESKWARAPTTQVEGLALESWTEGREHMTTDECRWTYAILEASSSAENEG